MNEVRELDCLELEAACAGNTKPSSGTGSFRDRIIAMKIRIGLPGSLQTAGLPWILPS